MNNSICLSAELKHLCDALHKTDKSSPTAGTVAAEMPTLWTHSDDIECFDKSQLRNTHTQSYEPSAGRRCMRMMASKVKRVSNIFPRSSL